MDNQYQSVKKTYSMNSLNTMTNDYQTPRLQSKICANCGYNFNDFLKTGYLGCSQCYQNFQKELEPYLNEFR